MILKGQFRKIFYRLSFSSINSILITDYQVLSFFHTPSHSPWHWPFNLVNADRNKILKLSMFEKGILYTFSRGIVMYVYFEFTVPLKAYIEWGLNFLNNIPHCSIYSLLLPVTPKIFQHCGPQRRKIIGIFAYNAEHYSAFLPTTWKSTLISVCVFFCDVAYTAEKLSALLTMTWKNFQIRISDMFH